MQPRFAAPTAVLMHRLNGLPSMPMTQGVSEPPPATSERPAESWPLSGLDGCADVAINATGSTCSSLARFLDGLEDVVAHLDMDGHILFVNEAWFRATGRSSLTGVGTPFTDHLHPDDRERAGAEFARLVSGATDSVRTEVRLTGPTGRFRWVEAIGRLVVAQAGQASTVAVSVRDITDRREMESDLLARQDRLRRTAVTLDAILNTLSNGLVVMDEQHYVVLVNERFWELFRLAPMDIGPAGLPVEELWARMAAVLLDGPSYSARSQEIMTAGQRGGPEEFRLADGSTLEREYLPVALDGQPYGHIWTFRDVTDRKAVESTLAFARDRALEASQLKSQFVATVSHEIRTPMHGVLGLSRMLAEMPLDAAARELAEAIHRSASGLAGLLDDILDLSRIEAGRLTIEHEEFSLSEAVADAVDMALPRARAKGLVLTSRFGRGIPDKVIGDALRLRQVLVNLIGNSVKFTETGSVTLGIDRADCFAGDPGSGDEADHSVLAFTVADTGPGIRPDAVGRVFDPFVQADGVSTRRHGGSGLGLAICRHLVELMGGTIELSSTFGVGTSVRFTLPLDLAGGEAPDLDAALNPPVPQALPPGRVLVAEDNEVNQLLVRRLLAQLGQEVDIAVSGQDAVRRAADGRYDLVLMDRAMPGMDGLAATREIRRLPGRAGLVAIVAMTASVLPSDRQLCQAAGMDDYLAKPFGLNQLRDVLERWLPAGRPGSAEPLLDHEVLTRLAQETGDPGVVADLLALFLETLPTRSAAVCQAVSAGDPIALAHAAHTLKSSAAMIGARRLAAVCGAAERDANDYLDGMHPSLPGYFEQVAGRTAAELTAEVARRRTELSGG